MDLGYFTSPPSGGIDNTPYVHPASDSTRSSNHIDGVCGEFLKECMAATCRPNLLYHAKFVGELGVEAVRMNHGNKQVMTHESER